MKWIKIQLIISVIIIISFFNLGCVESNSKYEYFDPGDWIIHEPSIYNNKIVWQDFRNDNSNGDIYIYDISEKKEHLIIVDDVEKNNIKIFNDKIIWGDYDIHIKMYDLTNENIRELSTGSYKPEIFENKVIWIQEFPNGSNYITLYDIETNKELLIANNGSTPDIWDNYIVWNDISEISEFGDDWRTSIYLYDIRSNEKMLISDYNSLKFHPRIHKDKIIWADNRNEKSESRRNDLYLYDITEKKERQLTNEQSIDGYNFDIYEDKIVWTDIRNDEGDIYCYDLTKNKEIPICTDKGWQKDPAIYKNKIVWHDENTVGGRFVFYTLEEENVNDPLIFYISISLILILIIVIISYIIWRRKKRDAR